MKYTFKYTEKNNESCTEYETKSLLYLIGVNENKNDISLLFIDCFNDLTGYDGNQGLWDMQSKGVKSLTPKSLGKALITLYKNFIEELNFSEYYLFIPSQKNFETKTTELIDILNINPNNETKKKIKDGLESEIKSRNNIEVITSDENIKIENFLKKVIVVIDNGSKSQYIKTLVEFKDKEFKSEDFYNEIFNEIRNNQSSLKNKNIENISIEDISEAVNFGKTLKTNDIKILVINRLVGVDLFSNDSLVPPYFISQVNGLGGQDIKDLVLDCKSCISRAYFDKNNGQNFWVLLEQIIKLIVQNRTEDPEEIILKIDRNVIKDARHFKKEALVFLVSLIKEGLEVENK